MMQLPRLGLRITNLQIYGRSLVALIARWLAAGSEAATLRRGEALSSCKDHPARPLAMMARAVTPARRAVALFAVAMFIVALAAFAAPFAAPAQAQSVGKLVSNTGQPYSALERVVGNQNNSKKFRRAIGFRTGAYTDGYTLWSVDVRVAQFGAGSTPAVSIFTASNVVQPSQKLCELDNPNRLVSGNSDDGIHNTSAMNTFTAPDGCLLARDTDYFVMFEETATGKKYRLKVTGTNNEDSGGKRGWTIGNVAYRQRSGHTTWRTEKAELIIALKGTVGDTVGQSGPPPPPNTPATGKPKAYGEPHGYGKWAHPTPPQVGQVIQAYSGTIKDADGVPKPDHYAEDEDDFYPFTYQWVRVDGGTETVISGQTARSYKLKAADVGKRVKVRVSFTDEAGHSEGPLTSDAVPKSGRVIAAPGPCPTNNDWCSVLTWGFHQDFEDSDSTASYGFSGTIPGSGVLADTTIDLAGKTLTISEILTWKASGNNVLFLEFTKPAQFDFDLVRGSVFNLGGTEYAFDEVLVITPRTFAYLFSDLTDFGFIVGQKVRVSLEFP